MYANNREVRNKKREFENMLIKIKMECRYKWITLYSLKVFNLKAEVEKKNCNTNN